MSSPSLGWHEVRSPTLWVSGRVNAPLGSTSTDAVQSHRPVNALSWSLFRSAKHGLQPSGHEVRGAFGFIFLSDSALYLSFTWWLDDSWQTEEQKHSCNYKINCHVNLSSTFWSLSTLSWNTLTLANKKHQEHKLKEHCKTKWTECPCTLCCRKISLMASVWHRYILVDSKSKLPGYSCTQTKHTTSGYLFLGNQLSLRCQPMACKRMRLSKQITKLTNVSKTQKNVFMPHSPYGTIPHNSASSDATGRSCPAPIW